MDDRTPPTRFLIALLLSLALHGLAALAVAVVPSAAAGGDEHALHLPRLPEPEDPEVRPGISDSQAATISWIGYDQYQEHLAPQAPIDQAALSMEPPAPPSILRPMLPAETPADAPTPTPPETVAAAAQPPAEPASRAPIEDALPPDEQPAVVREVLSLPAPPIDDAIVRIPDAPPAPDADQLAQPAPVREQPAPATIVGPPLPISETATEPTPAQDPSQSALASQPSAPVPGEPGEAADREAQAFSREGAPRIIPGRPLATKGLTINTIRPRWAHVTVITASPKDPLVEIRFTREGRVLSARFLESTGNREVDQPLMDAIYRWSATGEELKKIPAATPDAPAEATPTVRLVFRIGLRG